MLPAVQLHPLLAGPTPQKRGCHPVQRVRAPGRPRLGGKTADGSACLDLFGVCELLRGVRIFEASSVGRSPVLTLCELASREIKANKSLMEKESQWRPQGAVYDCCNQALEVFKQPQTFYVSATHCKFPLSQIFTESPNVFLPPQHFARLRNSSVRILTDVPSLPRLFSSFEQVRRESH